jgi:4-aminobutyrate aminotransferase-like enzyme
MALQLSTTVKVVAAGLIGSIGIAWVWYYGEEAVSRWKRRQKGYRQSITHNEASVEELYAERLELTCSALSVSYANTKPFVVQRGQGQYLFDSDGNRYLDTRNNVAHVGHCHPAIVEAVQAQVAEVCTNSRYLHPNFNRLGTRLLATFPEPMRSDSVVFFVNSGSEANDLALRIATSASRGRFTLALERAYHGHTQATLAVSPYKFDNARYKAAGWPEPVDTLVMPVPDVFRAASGTATAQALAQPVVDACQQHPQDIKAMIVESGMSVAGVVLPPEGYLRRCFQAVRQAGGVCICDEVQTGLGRLGSHWWCFELQDVQPDIVTMGKPFGNGLPLAAVVVRKHLAAEFAKGPEYFNTFGGNNVSVAAGLAVLDVVESEGLMAHAFKVGTCLKQLLLALPMTRQCQVGDVRGQGLFLGVEFIQDAETKTPATQAVAWLCSQLKDGHQILTSIDGAHDNVIIIKPPMCFSTANAQQLVAALAMEMQQLDNVDLATVQLTPT